LECRVSACVACVALRLRIAGTELIYELLAPLWYG